MNELVVSSDRQFGRALFGLNKTEVYQYLNEISSSYEELQLQIQVLKDQNDKLSDSNRDNALKLYNIQGELTEAQRKTDKANVELEASKKQVAALQKELAAAENRIQKLTDAVIKSGAEVPDEPAEPVKTESTESKGFTPKPIFGDEPKTEKPKDIFADLRSQAAAERADSAVKEEPVTAVEPDTSTTSSANNFDDDEVYAGEVDIEVDESMLIGNSDDEEEGFTFL
jgi:predicted RNase H-like nuclease (RuvC/YqgF family)